MLITTLPQAPLNIFLNDKSIEKVSKFKYLGLWLQENLKFNKHVSEVTSLISKSNGIIYSLKHILPLKSLITLYYSIVYSNINIHILARGGSVKAVLKHVNVAHNNVIRNLSLETDRIRNTVLYKALDILNIQEIYNYRCVEFIYVTLRGRNRLMADVITINSWTHEYDTRRLNEYRHPFCRININKSYFLCNAFTMWNSVPLNIKNVNSLPTFKKKCKQYFLNEN
jgi:hypothetical protein